MFALDIFLLNFANVALILSTISVSYAKLGNLDSAGQIAPNNLPLFLLSHHITIGKVEYVFSSDIIVLLQIFVFLFDRTSTTFI